jgi:alpha-glucosidase
VGDDIGGFAGSPTPELLTRWMELGVFNPIYRNHGSKGSRDREPWVDGPEHEAIRRRYIETRYQLLPYIYTGMEEAARTGIPLMRPMFLEFPDDPSLQTAETEFMFGSNLLVAPKINEMVGPYEVRLPAGVWYDFWTGKPVEGQSQRVDPPLDSLPVYVRGGTILPERPVVQSTDEHPQGPLQISVYPGPDCRGSLYEDDGNTLAYTRGEFLRMEFACDSRPQSLRLSLPSAQGAYKPWWSEMKIVLFGTAVKPRAVSVNGKDTSAWQFDSVAQAVTMVLPLSFAPTEIVLEKALN